MHLKAVLVVVAVDTVGIIVVLHEHEREARGEDCCQVLLLRPARGVWRVLAVVVKGQCEYIGIRRGVILFEWPTL